MKKSEITNTCVCKLGRGDLVCFLEDENGQLNAYNKNGLFKGEIIFSLDDFDTPENLEDDPCEEFCIVAIKKCIKQSNAICFVLNESNIESWDWEKNKKEITRKEKINLIRIQLEELIKELDE